MTTVIDVGNSAVKVAHAADGALGDVRRLPTVEGPDAAALDEILRGGADAVALVSVVPAWTAAVARAATDAARPLVLATDETIPLPVRLPSPAAVGADRLLAAWAARELVGAPCIVVDVGTATTVDVVDAGGAFVGGAIMPGPALAMRSLARGTALLPAVPLALPDHAIGQDTQAAIASGVMLGHVEAIGGLVGRMAREIGGRPTVVLTGGDAAALGMPDWADRAEPHLVLEALALLAAGRSAAPHAEVGA